MVLWFNLITQGLVTLNKQFGQPSVFAVYKTRFIHGAGRTNQYVHCSKHVSAAHHSFCLPLK